MCGAGPTRKTRRRPLPGSTIRKDTLSSGLSFSGSRRSVRWWWKARRGAGKRRGKRASRVVRKRQKRWRRISKSCHASIARAHPRATKGSLLDHGHDEVARVPGAALPPEPLEPRRRDRRSRRPSKHPQAPKRIPHAPSLNAHPESLEVAMRVARGMSQSLCIVLLLLTSGALSAENEEHRVRNIVLLHGTRADGSGWEGVDRRFHLPRPRAISCVLRKRPV